MDPDDFAGRACFSLSKAHVVNPELYDWTEPVPLASAGLVWEDVGETKPDGDELIIDDAVSPDGLAKLAADLQKKVTFTEDEYDQFGINDLRATNFIKSGSTYFKPVGAPDPEWTKLEEYNFEGGERGELLGRLEIVPLDIHHETKPKYKLLRRASTVGDFGGLKQADLHMQEDKPQPDGSAPTVELNQDYGWEPELEPEPEMPGASLGVPRSACA